MQLRHSPNSKPCSNHAPTSPSTDIRYVCGCGYIYKCTFRANRSSLALCLKAVTFRIVADLRSDFGSPRYALHIDEACFITAVIVASIRDIVPSRLMVLDRDSFADFRSNGGIRDVCKSIVYTFSAYTYTARARAYAYYRHLRDQHWLCRK